MFNGPTTFAVSDKWRYGYDTQLLHKGSFFEQPVFPKLEPPQYIVQTVRPYGYVGIPHRGTDEFLVNGLNMGYLDQRLMHAPQPKMGEAFIHNDTYTHGLRVNGLKIYRQKNEKDDFETWLASADNIESLLRSIYSYLLNIATKLEKLQSWAYTHVHTYEKPSHGAGNTSTTSPNTTAGNPKDSSYTNNTVHSDLEKGNNYNEDGQTKIKDSTNIITDL